MTATATLPSFADTMKRYKIEKDQDVRQRRRGMTKEQLCVERFGSAEPGTRGGDKIFRVPTHLVAIFAPDRVALADNAGYQQQGFVRLYQREINLDHLIDTP